MKNKILVFFLILFLAGLVYYFGFYQKETREEENEFLGIANPASVYCEGRGGVLMTKAFESGEKGFCLFEDGSQCEEGDFYQGICDRGQLKIEIIGEGEGGLIDKGNIAIVHYTAFLEDGTRVDSSWEREQPFEFVLGAGQVIEGWDQGILGMKTGEKRKLIISSGLAYGEYGVGDVISPGATLIFEVVLLDIR